MFVGALLACAVCSREAQAAEQPLIWDQLSGQQLADAIEQALAQANDVKHALANDQLRVIETNYFLLVTDIDEAEAAKWNGLLDKMYNRLLDMFGITRGTNIWHGKALVYIFKSKSDFVRYEKLFERFESKGEVAGLCHYDGPRVRIVFYRQGDDMSFATVLVHESSHAFVYRYRSPQRLDAWVSEGLAEWITYEILPRSTWKDKRVRAAKLEMQRRHDTGDLFDVGTLKPWQYGVAYLLTDYLIRWDKPRYVRFLDALKDQATVEEALAIAYRTTIPQVVPAYGKFIGVGELRK